jgi:CubicO group peptidase (beta-lactamase class C family)
MRYIIFGLSIITCLGGNMISAQAQVKKAIQPFIAGLNSIRGELKIPGMAAAVMKGDSVLFEGGFGYADLENHIKATANTTFRIASITKTFTSTLVMQLVEQGKLNLQSPISTYGLDFGNPDITVKNLLTHTSEGEPGTFYQYNGFRYGQLGRIIEQASGRPFYQLLMENIVKPLDMSFTAPGFPADSFASYVQKRKDMLPFFVREYSHLAKPYALNEKGEIVQSQYLNEFGAFGGLATTVGDLLKYSAAIDRNQFVSAAIQKEIWTAYRTKNGAMTPYGLGWFIETYRGIDFYWHYGQTQGESGLFVKVPSMALTLVVLTNSISLSQPFPLGDGDLFSSPVGQLFYKYLINQDAGLARIDYQVPMSVIKKKLISAARSPYKDFYNRELVAQAAMSILNGDTTRSKQFYDLYASLNFDSIPGLPVGHEIASIRNVMINQDISRSFTLTKPTKLRVYGVGENCSGDFNSWCDYGLIEDSSGKMVWQMQGHPAKHAGGAIKNQKIDAEIDLPAGTYKLRYKSDSGHAYNNWDSAPPDHFFWGIILFEKS